MKIRHFAKPPPIAPIAPKGAGGEAAAEAAAEAGGVGKAAPAADAEAKGSPEVTQKGGALSFPRVAGLAENAKVDRARTLLQTLRAADGEAFGGRVRGGVDVTATLKSYFRALELVPVLHEAGAGAAVAKYVEGLELPDDIRPLVAMAAGDVPTSGPLGSVATYERDRDSGRFWNDLRRSNDKDALRVTDATVKAFFGRWGVGRDLQGLVTSGHGPFQVGVFKLFARAKELGIKVGIDNYARYANALPANASSAAVLRRFARTFALDERSLTLGGRPLADWPTASLGAPLGLVTAFEQDSNAWHQAVNRGDPRAFQITDATLEHLAADGYTGLEYWTGGPPATHKDALRAFERFAGMAAVDDLESGAANLEGSKDIARALQRVGKACGQAVDHLVLRDRTVAEWASGKKVAAAAPGVANKPLGKVTKWDNDRNYNDLYNASHNAPRSVMAISDTAVKKWFGAWGPNNNLTAYTGDGTPESRVAYMLWWSRAQELGLAVQYVPQALAQYANGMPATAEAAAALRRFGRAFGVDVEHLSIGSRPLTSFAKGRGRAAAAGAGDALPALPPRPPLGDTKLLKPGLKSALDKKDEALFTVDDGSLKRLLDFDPQLTEAMGASRDRAWRVGVLSLAERALALGALDGPAVQALLQVLPAPLLDDPAVSALVATVVVKANLTADAVTLATGEPVSQHAETAAHVTRLARVLQGTEAELLPRRAGLGDAGPLGARQGPHDKYWNAHDTGFFEMNDASIRSEMMTWGDMSWLQNWNNHPGVFSMLARIIELNNDDGNVRSTARNNAAAWLEDPIPSMFGTADALPRILRMCKAAGVDPKTVVVEHNRSTVPLLKHPALQKLEASSKTGAPARARALADDVAMLAPNAQTRGSNGGPARPAERESAALRLLGVTDPEHPVVHELTEIFAGALPAMQAGEFARIDLARLPAKHKDALLATAFASHDHPAAIALLAGAFFSPDAEAVTRLLARMGHLDETARAMGAVSAQLARASVAELAFCMRGLSQEPPELASLPARAWLLAEPAAAEITAKLKAEPETAASLCALVLERATFKDTPPARRAAMLAVVDAAERQGLVERADIVALMPDDAKRALDNDVVVAARAAVTTLMSARTDDAVDAAKHALAAVFEQPTWSGDPNVIADAALATAAAHDLQFGASLGAVDSEGGGVAGKAWESRLAEVRPKVEVFGVKLAVEAENGRAPRVAVSAYPAPEGSVAAKALSLVATRWLAQRPFSIVDADGAAALRAVAQATGASITDVVVPSDAPLDALFGPAGTVSAALAAGGVVHLTLEGPSSAGQGAASDAPGAARSWPAGFAEALAAAQSTGGAEAKKARVVATGTVALPGVPALSLPPLDADALCAHGVARGLDEDRARLMADVLVDLRDRLGASSAAQGPSALPLAVVERVAARLRGLDDGNYTNLQRAISLVASAYLPAGRGAELAAALRQHINAADDDAPFTLARRVARLGDVPFKVVAAGVKAADLPDMTPAERVLLRGAAWALEVQEPVAGDRQAVERIGIAYGTMTGRDVHVHLLHAASKPSDVLSKKAQDLVVVAHGFADAPAATRAALLAAAAEGRIRLLVEESPRVHVDGAFPLGEAAAQAAPDALAARALAAARAVGLPDVVGAGVCTLLEGVRAGVDAGELEPLLKRDPAVDLDDMLALLKDLLGAMPLPEAFVAAASATWPMHTREQQEKLEEDAREVVG